MKRAWRRSCGENESAGKQDDEDDEDTLELGQTGDLYAESVSDKAPVAIFEQDTQVALAPQTDKTGKTPRVNPTKTKTGKTNAERLTKRADQTETEVEKTNAEHQTKRTALTDQTETETEKTNAEHPTKKTARAEQTETEAKKTNATDQTETEAEKTSTERPTKKSKKEKTSGRATGDQPDLEDKGDSAEDRP